MSRESLGKKTTKELRDAAKDLNIQGRWDMTKQQLIDAIAEKEVEVVEVEAKVEEKESAEVVDMEKKMPYIETAEIGLIVAFKLESGKVKTAKIVNKSGKNRK